ncbi:MAG: GxxExxY protein [Janthinobacterium lividum]
MYELAGEWVVDGLNRLEEPAAEYTRSYGVDLAAYNPFTRRIIGCAMQVHSLLGSGFPEVIYQRALSIELEREEVVAQRELEVPIFYREQRIGTRRVDFLAAGPTPEQSILVELKATTELTDSHFAQIINYLEAYHLHVGLLLNFGTPSLHYRRFIKTHFAT